MLICFIRRGWYWALLVKRDWLRQDDELKDLTLEALSEDPTAYVLPSYEEDAKRDELLEVFYPALFEEELEAWWQDETVGPKKRNFKTFKEWFDVEFHTLVIDLCDPIIEEYESYPG